LQCPCKAFANALHASCKLLPFFGLFPCQAISSFFFHPSADFWPVGSRVPRDQNAVREQTADGRDRNSSPCGKLDRREGFALLQPGLGFPALSLRGTGAFAKQCDSSFRFRGQGSEKPVDRPCGEAGPMVLARAPKSGEKTPVHPFTKETGTDPEEASHGGKWPDASRFRAQSVFDTRAPLQNSPHRRRVFQKVEKPQTSLVLR
jgi:hypothetical protein